MASLSNQYTFLELLDKTALKGVILFIDYLNESRFCYIFAKHTLKLEAATENNIFIFSPSALLDGTNVRLNWNIESDMNVYWI